MFIKYYPAYTIEMVLNEYLVRFFAMIKYAQRVDAQSKLELINIVSVPHLKRADSKKIIEVYRKIIENDDTFDKERIEKDRKALAKVLRGRML